MKEQKIIEKIKKEFNENINSHIFLMETNDFEKCLNDIKLIIKSIINADETTARQIDNETFLEQVIIKSDEKDIKKDSIIYLQERLKTKPVLSKYLFYIIVEANKLNDIAANKLLKTIEEPEENIIGFLITNNLDSMLPTIRSRCQIERIIYLDKIEEQNNGDNEEIAKSIINFIEKQPLHEFNIYKLINKNIKDNAIDIANIIKDYYNIASNIQKRGSYDLKTIESITKNNSYNIIIKKSKLINKALNKLSKNMNKNMLLEKIVIELKEVK